MVLWDEAILGVIEGAQSSSFDSVKWRNAVVNPRPVAFHLWNGASLSME